MQKRRVLAIALAMSMTLGMHVYAEETLVEESISVETEALVEESVIVETEAILEMPETEYVEELEAAKKYSGLEEFVARLYRICLSREPDATGLNDWTSKLRNKKITGIQAAYGFVFSPEFIGRNLCNSDFVEQLYQAFMGRKSDAAGKADWVGKLSRGVTREEVFNGFALSVEFDNLCNIYGIEPGKAIEIPAQGTRPNGKCKICGKTETAVQDGVTGFVQRLYSICLNRNADAAGLADWTNRLRTRKITGRDAAFGFFFSPEFINKKYNDSTYVEYLYKAMMGRNSDPAGKKDWMNRLANGWTREMVFDGFAGSQEFTGICADYNITRGVIPGLSATEQYNLNIFLSNFVEVGFNAWNESSGTKNYSTFYSSNGSKSRMLMFVFSHCDINEQSMIQHAQIGDKFCISLTLSQVNSIMNRFFGRTVTADDARNNGFIVQNNRLYKEWGWGDQARDIAVVEGMTKNADGTITVPFKTYWVEYGIYGEGHGHITNKAVYKLTSAQAAADTRNLSFGRCGVAVLRPYNYNGKSTYQLVSYRLF